ncbi:alpha/beta hydrolase [Sphingobium tyrosinilyticum]
MMQASLAAAPAPVGLPELADVVNESIEGPIGPIPIRRYTPVGAAVGKAVYFHSGGWVVGTLDHADSVCRRLAAQAGCVLVSVDYRLAPEHPYPQPFEDAYAALLWAAGALPGPLLVVGESAGGNLAAACTIRARDEDGPEIAGQVLAYPATDHDFETASHKEVGGRNWLLSTADMRWFWDHYCPEGIDRNHPWIAPLRVPDASKLPPAFIRVAQLDPLRDEGLAYGRKLVEAGILVDADCDANMLHGYWSAAGLVEAATGAVTEAGNWMRERLHVRAQAY